MPKKKSNLDMEVDNGEDLFVEPEENTEGGEDLASMERGDESPAELAEEGMEDVPVEPVKPKRKYVRKKAKASVEAAPVQIDSIEKVSDEDSEASPEPVAEEVDPEELKEIKPRFLPDADFLAPESPGNFQLREKPKRNWLRTTLYTLGTLVILLAIGVFVFSFYSAKLLTKNDTNDQSQQQTDQNQEEQAPSTLSMSIMNLPSDLQSALSNDISDKFSSQLTVNQNSQNLPQVSQDTLFVKGSASNIAPDVLTYLSTLGIKAQLESNDSISSDLAFYGVATLSKPDLGAETAVVYNATGVTGLAKKNCDILKAYNASGCQALNSTSTQTGTVVEYKDEKTMFVLKRTNEFRNATYKRAQDAQVEDIRITLGK